MSDSPENQVNLEAPGTGASASAPEVHVTSGGKSRPSVAGARRVHVVVPSVKKESASAQEATDSDAVPAATMVDDATKEGVFEGEASGAEGSEAPSSSDTAQEVRARVSAKKHKPLSKNAKIGLVICILVMILVCVFSLFRWVLPQDGADIRGSWTMEGAKNAIAIDDAQIDLAGEASYEYSLDNITKTIQVEFFTKNGSAHYRFSADRQSMAIIESDDLSWSATLFSDIAWSLQDFIAMVQDQPRNPLGDDKGIVLFKQ